MTSIGNQMLRAVFGRKIVSLRLLNALRSERDALRSERDALSAERDELCSASRQYLYNTPLMLDRLEKIGSLLRMKTVEKYSKTRIGSPADGGYVCLADLDDVVAALSIGIGGDVSWDAAIADGGVRVYQYDHTVTAPPTLHDNFVFHQTKLGTCDEHNQTSLASILAKYNLRTPASVIAKIDIEGDEWDVLNSVPSDVLSVFSQIVCEFHWFHKLNDDEFFGKVMGALSKLALVFEPVHVHGNNYAPVLHIGNITLPDVLEVTFVNKRKYDTLDGDEVFPTSLDAPNNPTLKDYPLGYFRFPTKV